MKMTVNRSDLETLTATLAPLARHGTLPALNCLLIEAGKKGARMAASNLDQYVRMDAAAEVADPGEVCVSAGLLAKLAKEMDGEAVTMETDGAVLRLTCGGFDGKLLTIAAEDFVAVPKCKGDAFPIPADAFKLVPFASTDETRHVLNWVHLEAELAETLTAVATDGRRLAAMQFDSTPVAVGCTVPSTACGLFAKLAAAGNATLAADNSTAVLTAPGVMASTKLIEGTYPNWRQVVPTWLSGEVFFEEPHLFIEAVRRVALLCNEKSAAVKLTLGKDSIKVSVATADVGEACETVKARINGGQEVIAVSPDYLLSAVSRPAQFVIRYADATSPLVIEGGAFTAVVMPMRVA